MATMTMRTAAKKKVAAAAVKPAAMEVMMT